MSPDDQATQAARDAALKTLRAGLAAEEDQREGRKDQRRSERIAIGFRPDETYEHLLSLRDSRDPRWEQAGRHLHMAAAMYEQQRAIAEVTPA